MKEKIIIGTIFALSITLGVIAHNWYLAIGVFVVCMSIMFWSHLHTVRMENRYRTQKYNTYVIHMHPDKNVPAAWVNARPHTYMGKVIPHIPEHLLDQCVFVTQGNMNAQYNEELRMLVHVGNKCLLDPKEEIERLKVVCVPFRDAAHANEDYFSEGEEADYAKRVVEVIKADHLGRRLVLKETDPEWDREFAMDEKVKPKTFEEFLKK